MTTQPSRDHADVPEFLEGDVPPVLIFGGKGGVGKTTSAAASALTLATLNPSESVVLVSTDPAHSVRDAVADAALPPNLRVEELDSDAEHAAFMNANAGILREIASRGTFLDDTDIERFLDLSIPGVDELMSFVRLARWFEDEAADRFVIDTAPTGHALRLLGVPEVTRGWMEAIEALLGKHRYMASVFGGGSSDDVEAFVEDFQEIFDNIAAVWAEPSMTRFVPVFNAERMSIAETDRLLASLDDAGIAAPHLICNRLVPPGADGSLAALRGIQAAALAELPDRLSSRSITGITLGASEPRGDELHSFFARRIRIDETMASAAADAPLDVAGGVSLAGRFTLVAGKGGVGKTTVSCAAATRLAAEKQRTLIISTDPAGSLGDAFGVEIGREARSIAPYLDAMQLDADAELRALKDDYADELEGFFDGLAMELSFDREALENLLELAPTGLDEVMALVRMTEVLDDAGDDPYASIVIDTAPTGHTLRLLDLPEMVQAWLEQIFAVLVKYQDMISLPRLNDRLLRLSRGLKVLRGILDDADQTTLLAVTIPTKLAVAETARLVEGAGRLGVPVSGIVINQVTRAGADELSNAIAARERREIETLRAAHVSMPLAMVSRCGDLRGVGALQDLGVRLIGAHGSGQKAA
ncbi:MAG: ArsA family ATPase [Planctomycetota bacterium]